jgi:hypothetical protein
MDISYKTDLPSKKYEDWDMDNPTTAVACVYDIDKHFEEKMMCIKIMRVALAGIQGVPKILWNAEETMRGLEHRTGFDSWKNVAKAEKQAEKGIRENSIKALEKNLVALKGKQREIVSRQVQREHQVESPHEKKERSIRNTIENLRKKFGWDEEDLEQKIRDSYREEVHEKDLLPEDEGFVLDPNKESRDLETLQLQVASLTEEITQGQDQVRQLAREIEGDYFTDEEKKSAEAIVKTFAATGASKDKTKTWKQILRELVQACLKLKNATDTLLQVKLTSYGSVQGLKRNPNESELQWALKVEAECEFAKWLIQLWDTIDGTEVQTIERNSFDKFRRELSYIESVGWRHVEVSDDGTKIMSRIVAKCRQENPESLREIRQPKVMMGKRVDLNEKVVKKTKTEGSWRETQEEIVPKSDEEEPVEKRAKKSKEPVDDTLFLTQTEALRDTKESVQMYLTELKSQTQRELQGMRKAILEMRNGAQADQGQRFPRRRNRREFSQDLTSPRSLTVSVEQCSRMPCYDGRCQKLHLPGAHAPLAPGMCFNKPQCRRRNCNFNHEPGQRVDTPTVAPQGNVLQLPMMTTQPVSQPTLRRQQPIPQQSGTGRNQFCKKNHDGQDCDPFSCHLKHGKSNDRNMSLCRAVERNIWCQFFFTPKGCTYRHKRV